MAELNSNRASSVTYEEYKEQAEKLSLVGSGGQGGEDNTVAKRALFVTPNDAVVETARGDRLPPIPVREAEKLNRLEEEVNGGEEKEDGQLGVESEDLVGGVGEEKREDGKFVGVKEPDQGIKRKPVPGGEKEQVHEEDHQPERESNFPEVASKEQESTDSIGYDSSTSQKSVDGQESTEQLGDTKPPSTTNPLFPPLPLYGPSSLTRDVQCYTFRITSFFLSLAFLSCIFAGGIYAAIKEMISGEPETERPFYQEEKSRLRTRESEEKAWLRRQRRRTSPTRLDDREEEASPGSFLPTEGGKDPIVCDVSYYARRVGLDMEEYKVQTEDGFIIVLWHIYNPAEYTPKSAKHRSYKGPNVFKSTAYNRSNANLMDDPPKRKYPVLLIHGLLQSSGAFCTNDDHSLAFYLAKSGYDVWLGNNRCGFNPEHTLLTYSDPRMWNWNIRQMGVLDLPALISRVLHETGFQKLALVGHSQGTTQTLVALAKTQRPDLGDKISVFCALAPAAYGGPLLDRKLVKFFRILSPAMYKLVFGIHAFIPTMLFMHKHLPPNFYGKTGYLVFSFLFNWSDRNWDRGLRDRMFQFAPVYVSAEAMRWWLGRDCFAKQKCILATREEWEMEDVDDDEYDTWALNTNLSRLSHPINRNTTHEMHIKERKLEARKDKAWFDERSPPMAFWVAGSDDLVDGKRLLRRMDREEGREPCVRVVKSKVVENYEHLDLIWAIDSIRVVGREVKEVIWQTVSEGVRREVVMPRRCEEVEVWTDPGPITVGKD